VDGCFAPYFVEREWGRAPQHDWVVETLQAIEDGLVHDERSATGLLLTAMRSAGWSGRTW